nr:mRNA capping enzyme, catalytic domain containing protein [Pandoravirus belohorizontensis]
MPDGARADAAERGFYAAWGLAPRPRADDPARRQPLHRRNPGPNPISVSLAVLRDLNPDEYVVAEKTDGVRYALLLCGDEAGRPMAVMIDRAGRKFEVAVRAAARFFGGTGTLFDGELAWERAAPQTEPGAAARPLTVDRLVEVSGEDADDNGKPSAREAGDADSAIAHRATTGKTSTTDRTPTTAHGVAAGRTPTTTTTAPDTLVYWVFDAVCVAGVSQRDADYETRIELVQRLLLQGRDADELVEAAPGANAHGLEFRPKPCVAARLVDSVWSGDAPRLRHGSDGLVLTPLRDPIRTGTHWRQFKWKYKHTFDLQLRGRRRPDGTWLWGLYYLEADWTVPTADALARAARPPPPASESPAAAPADAPVARYLNACEGITYRRSDVARASLDRASAAAQRGRSRGAGAVSSRAPAPTTAGAGDDAECLVVFVLQKDAALDALVERVLAARPDARSIKCVVECEGAFVAPPAGWTPPAHAPPGGVRLLRCAIERLRTDKTDPNVRYTVRQTILNIDESITYATVRAALCRPRAPVL